MREERESQGMSVGGRRNALRSSLRVTSALLGTITTVTVLLYLEK